jgi:hypothetical protein
MEATEKNRLFSAASLLPAMSFGALARNSLRIAAMPSTGSTGWARQASLV